MPPTNPAATRRSLAVILNPVAGNRRAAKARSDLREALEASGAHFELIPTREPRHGVALAAEVCSNFDAVVAAGGDGTVHEVAAGLHAAGSKTPLGVIPLGTGNDFGDLIQMPARAQEAIEALQNAAIVEVDGGHVRWREGGREDWQESIFLNAVGIGFDAMVAIEAAKFKALRGITAYLAGIVSALSKWDNPTVRVERTGPTEYLLLDGSTSPASGETLLHEGRLFLAGIGNGRTVGGGFTLTPHAVANDGLFDLCFVAEIRKLRLPILIPKAVRGTHLGEPEVVSERVSGLRILSPEVGLPLHFDGEVLARSAIEIEVSVLPRAFRVLCPSPEIDSLQGLRAQPMIT